MSKEAFKPLFDRLIQNEGGYVNDPNDLGGETNWGVTARTARANGYYASMINMTRDDAFEIYYSAFWLRYQCDRLSPALAFQFFDACVNHGFGNACRILQRAVGVADDGIIGRVTLAAINERDDSEAVILFTSERLRFYTKLRAFSRYGRGWTNRVAENLQSAAEDLSMADDYNGF